MHCTFNTGRCYSPRGQEISFRATVLRDGACQRVSDVVFEDHTRMIAGRVRDISLYLGESVTDAELARKIARRIVLHYDRGDYTATSDEVPISDDYFPIHC